MRDHTSQCNCGEKVKVKRTVKGTEGSSALQHWLKGHYEMIHALKLEAEHRQTRKQQLKCNDSVNHEESTPGTVVARAGLFSGGIFEHGFQERRTGNGRFQKFS